MHTYTGSVTSLLPITAAVYADSFPLTVIDRVVYGVNNPPTLSVSETVLGGRMYFLLYETDRR